MGPLVGDVPEYGTGCIWRDRGEGAESNLFRGLQHPERTEWRFGVGVKKNGSDKHGCWGVSRN